MATTIFPTEFEQSESNIEIMQRYLRSFPIRLRKDGYNVSDGLVKICKAHSKQTKRKRGDDDDGTNGQ